jgi:hypothetical protein
MLLQSVLVEGLLIRSEADTGLADLSIEAWSLGEDVYQPLAEGRSDAQGMFVLDLPLVPEFDIEDGIVRLEFRIYDHRDLILAEVREILADQGPQPVQFFVPSTMSHRSRGGEAADSRHERHEVHGRVWGPIIGGANIRGVLYALRSDGSEHRIEQEIAGETPVDKSGLFHLQYNPSAHNSTASVTSLELQLRGPEDELLVESAPVDITRQHIRVDLRMPGGDRGPSEYELLEDRFHSEIEAGSAILDGLSPDALFELADEIDVEPERLALLQRVRALEAETGLPAPIFYALGSNGLSVELVDLIDVPQSELRATINAAIDDEIISETMTQDVDTLLAQLSESVVEQVLEADQSSMGTGFGEILASADLPREVVREMLGRYQTRSGGVAEFWESLLVGDGEQEAVDEDVRSSLELAIDIGGLLGAEPVLVRRVLALRREGRWQALEDLADFDFDDWCELLESLDAPDTSRIMSTVSPTVEGESEWTGEGSDTYAGFQSFDTEEGFYFDESEIDGDERYENQYDEFDDDELDEYDEFSAATVADDDLEDAEEEEQDWVEVRAEAILDTLEEAFPSKSILRELHQAEELSEGAYRLLERVPGHDFLSESIRERASQDSELLEGYESIEAEAVVEEVEAIERVSRVTQHAEEVAVLVGTGMHSAHTIAAQPRRHFIDAYGEALGGRAQASRVHAQAQQTAGASTLAMVNLLQALQQTPLVLGGGVVPAQATRDHALKDVPDARTLFGSIGLCGCEHCGSVYSPAAYLVDLLRYLDIRDPARLKKLQDRLRQRRHPVRVIRNLSQYKPLDVLLARRTDIADIPLTCENTLTPLPYIDLVNELLEAQITGRSAAHDTGSTPADVLKAVPQYIDREAYERLRQAIYPASLPFHEPLAVARAYLGHLGVQRRDLLKSLARDKGPDDALLAENLEMSPEEFSIVSKPPTQLWRHFGFEAEQVGGIQYTQVLAHAPTFLSTTGISFQELIDLVSTRFINSKDEIKLESQSPDCDPEKVRINGLDQNRLSRMVRLLRVRKHLGFSLFDLDRALFAIGAKDLDTTVLQKLVEVRDLGKKLDRPIVELLGLWASLDTFGKDNLFERLLRTRAVTWRTKDVDTFKLQENRLELAHTADRLDAVAPALLAAFRMTSEELSLVRTLYTRLAGAAPRLDLAGLSAVYRVAFLARALKMRIDQLDGLLRLVPADANPFHAADPASTRRFVEIVHQVQASDFAPEKLVYLYQPAESPRSDPGPTDAQVQSVLAGIRRGLVEAFSATERPAELTGNFLRQKLGMYLDTALVDPAMEVLDPRKRLTDEKRRQFFNRHLARIFPDAEEAAQFLFASSSSATSAGVSPATARPRGEAEAASGQSAASTPAAPAQASAVEQRWRANIERVVQHLLPVLRARQMRGAVVQVLSDTLGTSSISTGRLLDGLMHSRRSAGRPLIEDFFALLGTGLTGRYFASGEQQGEPAVTRTDAKLEFSWAGASPATGMAGTGFSVRWTGRLLPRSKAPHTFFVNTDGGVRLSIKIDGTDQVVLEETGGTGAVAEYVSRAIPLDPAKLYEIKVEYRNKGAAASFTVQYGTSPDSKQPIPTANLFPMDGLSAFDPVSLSYRRLHKASLLLTGFGVSDDQLEWLTGEPRYLDLDKLPMEPTDNDKATASFQRWRQLAALYALRKRLPTSNTDLFAIFKADTLAESITALVKATGWDKAVVEAFVGEKGFAVDRAGLALPIETAQEPFLLRLERAMGIQRRLGVSPETLFSWASSTPDADIAASIVQTAKARYDEKRWLEVARGLNDPLRKERREALVAYLLPRLREQGVKNRNQLFEYFLIDVEMNPCMLTSRIKQAISAVQTFFQRCLMNLEAQVPARLVDQGDWKWLKNYRVWEANRKVFLYPENWIEPELRDDKSPEFKTLERTILQQEIKKENVESAFIDYLQRLDEMSRLDVRATWFEHREQSSRPLRRQRGRVPPPGAVWEDGTYHIFARTYNAPHTWFYRRLERGRTWTPWEKIDADIEGDHLVPVMFQNRLHLFWTVFREKNKPTPKLKKDAKPFKLGKDWEIGLAYSVYDRGRWTRKQLSSSNVVDRIQIMFLAEFQKEMKKGAMPRVEGSAWLPDSAYTLQAAARNDRGRLTIYLYRRAVDRLQAARSSSPRSGQGMLSRTDVELIAQFQLVGCNGELAPVILGRTAQVIVGQPRTKSRRRRGVFSRLFGRKRKRTQRRRLPAPTRLPPFQISRGGRLPVPSGYRVDGTGFRPSTRRGALLQLPASTSGGLAPVLGRARGSTRGIRILPIADTSSRPTPGLFPFFFQDLQRSYFVRPVPMWIGSRTIRVPRAVPLSGPSARRFVPRLGRSRNTRRGRKRSRRRESLELARNELALDAELGLETSELEAELDLHLEEVDDWEDIEDDAWHPEDADERRGRRRRRKRTKARRPRPRPTTKVRPRQPARPRLLQVRQAAHWEQRLRFIPFEHPQTCRLINTLKSGGIDRLLALSTTRMEKGEDHTRVNGRWLPNKRTRFERDYRPGLLTDRQFPRLDVDFDYDNPYALYNWELFFHAPLQVATRLAKDGRHEEAQRWFHFIFDPTTDASSPPPSRYWRFAPFHENTEYDGARRLMALLSYAGADAGLIARQQKVRDQVTAWWEAPFNPHAIARVRIAAYQKAVVMKYIDNLIEWGDKLFRRDSMESIQEATQLYILAGNILGQRPERVPSMVETRPVTFRQVREKLDPFANWVVRFENSQVRRPFRINARPDVGATTSVLGMATQYFCVPVNPDLDKKWDSVADRLFKIRNCMNIKGVVRQLPLFEPPIDPGMLVRAAAAGVDLGSVIASLNAPPPVQRFRFLVQRAIGLAEQLRSFGASMLNALERRDAEQLATLHQSNETVLLEAIRDVQKTRINQVEEELAWQALQRDYVDAQIQHVTTQAQELMNPQENAKQESLKEAQIIAGVAEGVDLVAKVMHAIPDFQAGAAGGFSSPFTTVQLGGQMFGKISSAVAESMFKAMNKFQTEAEMSAAQAEYQQRQAEFQYQLELLGKERERIEKQIEEVQLKLEISNAELKRHDTAVGNARKVAEYLREKYTNEELYGWMIGQLSSAHFQAYKFAFDTAKLAERALLFEQGDSSTSHIEFSYWDSLKKGLLSGERLLLDIRRMESAHLEGDRRALEVTRHVSLKEDAPMALQELLATGRCRLDISEAMLDGDFSGHYFRRVKTVSMTMTGSVKSHSNINCTLTLLDNRIRTSANASGSYPQTQDGEDARFLMNAVPVQAIATSRPNADSGVFQLSFDEDRYLPFEGAGAISSWRIELQQSNNMVDLSALTDVILSLSYTAKSGGAPLEAVARANREKGLARGGLTPPPQYRVSLRRDLPALWKQLQAAKAEQNVELKLPLARALLPGRFLEFDLRVERVTFYAQSRNKLADGVLQLQIAPAAGAAATATGWNRPWSSSQTLRATADVKGTPGSWTLTVGAKGTKVSDLLDDLVLIFDLRAKRVQP